MNLDTLWHGVIGALVFSLLGLGIFVAGFFVVRKLLPFDVHKELEVDQNTAVGLVVSSFILGLAFIIGMSIHG
jgi:uncharacterized membrane protein YjfL (UPF0719 family)